MRRTLAMPFMILVLAFLFAACGEKERANPHAAAMEKQKQEEWAAAIVEWDQIIAANPQDAGAFHHRGFCKKRQGDLAGAIEDYTASITIAPDVADTYAGRGEASAMAGDTTSACSDFAKAIELGYKQAEALQQKYCL